MRAAQEFRDGDHVMLGSGLPALCANHVPQSIKVTLHGEGEAPTQLDVAVLAGLEVSRSGDLASAATSGTAQGAARVLVVMEHTTEGGQPRIMNACKLPLAGTGLVHRIVTDLAVIDVTKEGLVLREVAPGVSAAEVQASTEAPLFASHDLKEMEL
jgi:3-oxoacid CoA-transferase subunit B